MRTYGIQNWNWSSRANKWVYVNLKNGKRVYKYQKETPKEFEDLTGQLRELNLQLLAESDHESNIDVFKKMVDVSQRLQAMKR